MFCKSDVILLADDIEEFVKVSFEEYGGNPLYCVSLPGYTYQCALKYTGIILQTLQDKDLILLIESDMRGGISSVMRDRYVKSNDNENYYTWMLQVYMVTQCLNCYLMKK